VDWQEIRDVERWAKAPLSPAPDPMPPPRRKADADSKAAKVRPWRASLLRARNHFLGVVYAADEKAAEAAAVAEFKIDPQQRRRLVVREDE
jgi:hypothetical protein